MTVAEDQPGFEVEQRRVVVDDFLKLEEVWFRHRNRLGKLSDRRRSLFLERGDAVAVLLHNIDTDRVILIDQFRYPAHADGGWLIETIAGMLEKGEAPEDAVRREAFEETGYQLADMRHVATFYTSPGGSSERIHLYFSEVTNASHVGPGGGLVEEGEDISLHEYSPNDLADAVAAGDIRDGKTLVAVQWFLGRRTAGDA
jgi:nudix-type nucleoside diphosphatase (YffH/AdpP family)